MTGVGIELSQTLVWTAKKNTFKCKYLQCNNVLQCIVKHCNNVERVHTRIHSKLTAEIEQCYVLWIRDFLNASVKRERV